MGHWVTAASSLLAFLLYYNTLDAGFVYDDRRAILSNPDVIGHTPLKALFENDFWGTPLADPGSHGSYRPLCVATYRFNYAFSGFEPWSFHFLNILFHCMASALVVVLARRLLPGYCMRIGTAVAGLTFAAHPIHTEAVAGIVGRADLAACNLFLMSVLIYIEHIRIREQCYRLQRKHILKNSLTRKTVTSSDQPFRLSCHSLVQHIMMNFRCLLKSSKAGPMKLLSAEPREREPVKLNKCQCSGSASEDSGELLQWLTLAGTLTFAAAATLCKEPAIMVLPLCILYDFLKGSRQEDLYAKRRWRSVCALGLGGLALLCWRVRLTGTRAAFAAADNPAARDPSFFTRTFTFAYLPIFNFFLLIYPFHLSFDWSMDAIPRITTLFDQRNISTIIFYAVISKVTWRAIVTEFKKRQENSSKEPKYNKKQNLKKKHKRNNNYKQYNKQESVDRKNYHAPHKDDCVNRQLCPCNGCKHALSEEHTSACRAVNNNNRTRRRSACVCAAQLARAKALRGLVCRSPQEAMLMSIALMALPFIPASNILFYVGFVVAERVLYIPSVGFCLLLGLGAGALTRHWQKSEVRSRFFMVTLLIVLAAMCGSTMRRNTDWRDEESLFRSALNINPPKAYGNLGSVLSARGRVAEAEIAFERALKHRPNMADVHYNLGIILQNQRRYGEAIKSFEKAITFRPSMALAYVNLGASLMADGRLAEAAIALRDGASADGQRVRDRREHDAARVSALVQLAALHSKHAHWHKALSAYKEALHILPSSSDVPIVGWTKHDVLSMISEMHVQLQQWAQAERSLLEAHAASPRRAGTLVAVARVIAKNATRSKDAEMWFNKALLLAPNDPTIRDHFGTFLASQQREREAAEQLVTAARLAPQDGARAAAAARALREARRCRSAERWYAKAVQLKPEDADFHSNFGAILHLNGKYAAAATAYRRALQLQPGDEITMTNLKRVRSLMANQRKMAIKLESLEYQLQDMSFELRANGSQQMVVMS